MLATQLEYRLVLRWRLGLVGFGGIGEVAPSVGEFRGDQLLPAGGTGIRFLLSKKFQVNLKDRFWLGQRQLHMEHGRGRGILAL